MAATRLRHVFRGGERGESDFFGRRALRRELHHRFAVVTGQRRQCRTNRLEHQGPRRVRVLQRQTQQLQAGAMREQQFPRNGDVGGGPELEQHPEMVRQLVIGQEHARLPVCRLEPEQRHSPVAGVAMLEVRQIEAAPPLVVEGRDEVRGQLRQRDGLEVRQEGGKQIRDRGRQPHCRIAHQPDPRKELLVGIPQKQRGALPRKHELLGTRTSGGWRAQAGQSLSQG
jgi:hypothetical protein